MTTKVNGAKTLDLEALNMSQSQREELAKLASFERARRRFFHFCAFVKIIAGTLEDGITVTPLKMWPHVKKTIAALESTNRIVYAKSRQLGATTQRASQTNDAFVAGVKTLSQFERMQERAQMRLSAGFALFDVEVVCSHGTK